jgi:hypothetical protein
MPCSLVPYTNILEKAAATNLRVEECWYRKEGFDLQETNTEQCKIIHNLSGQLMHHSEFQFGISIVHVTHNVAP